MQEPTTDAGQSAQAEYERRAAKDAADRAHRRGLKIGILAVTPVVVYLLVRYGAPAALDLFFDRLSTVGDTEPAERPPLDTYGFHVAGLLLAGVATLGVGRDLFGKRQTTQAWAKGAAGERATAATLARLPDSYVVLHDLPIPGSRANIDHVVVGPTGVFTVETKNYSYEVVIRNGTARSGRYPLGKVVNQAKGQAATVSAVLGVTATPLVVVQGAGIDAGWFGKPEVGGVRFTSNRGILNAITNRTGTFDDDQIAVLANHVRAEFVRKPRPKPQRPSPSGTTTPPSTPTNAPDAGGDTPVEPPDPTS